jgi:hypothetical protein
VTVVVSKGARKPAGLPTDDLRMRPAWFPYPLDAVTGKILYENGTIRSLEEPLQARNGQVRLSSQLVGEFVPDGSWNFHLQKLIVNGLQLPDEQLSNALPHDLAVALEQLQFGGGVAIAGELDFSGNASPNSAITAWDVGLDLDEANFNVGLDLRHAHGQARLRGRQSFHKLRCQGDLLMDSVMHDEIHLTDVRGPFWFDGQTLFVGSRVPVKPDATPAPSLRAKVHDGTLLADATIELSGTPFFALNAQLVDADISSIARDMDPQHHRVTGRLAGGLKLRGSAIGWHTLEGEGNLQVSEANLYELPLILALLKRLRYGNTDTSAFTNCDLEYRIKGRDVLFDRFDLTGETVTLKGTGWSGPEITNAPENASREISLDFYSIVGREHMFMPILRPVIGEASRQFLLITVRGTLENPITRQEVLPGLNDAIRKAFPEISGDSSIGRRRGLLKKR